MRYSALLSLSLTLLSWVAPVRSQNCQLQVPANPLTAQGLATPYVLTGCNQLDFANQGAFVEAAILDPATGNIQIYSPLVINAGMTPVGNGTGASPTASGTTSSMPTPTGTNVSTTTPSMVASSTTTSDQAAPTMAQRQAASTGFYIPPIVPTIPNNAVVGLWFGSNAASVTLTGSTDGCVNGLGNSVFGQFAFCNGQAWFNAAKAAVSQGLVKIPAPGAGSSGQACPTTHDFRVVDQDQSDNVVTTYLLIGNNTLSQNTPANNKANPNAAVLSNASDNALITQFIDPALGCAPYQNPCTTCPTGQSPALATDELLAFFFPPASGPALVPLNNPMVLVNGQPSLPKVNLYRDGTGQPHADNNNASAVTYCQQIAQSGIFINQNQQLFTNAGSPAPDMANNLFTFLAMRFSASFGPAPGACSPPPHVFSMPLTQSVGLGCTGLLNVANPVDLTMDGNGVVTAATINTQSLQQILAGATGGATTAASSTSPSASASTAASSVSAGTSATASTTPSPTGVLLRLTSAAGSATQAPTMGSTPTCMSTATVTVTVTAMVCPTQASFAASPSPTAPNGGWNDGQNGGWNYGRYHRKRSTVFTTDRIRRKSRIVSFG
ncbi:hypothetical protein JVT61DRAFT_1393 [Boletus reticuloceps]|uniref:Uncharacterized protein n=1 Tax=Boletus reticuloceps TaxID=495285 RepID=A0A8I2YC33_9AGAM|nr:hypothetical protein JVT61DRAFT_1393 [Boletus reticuloceps]